MSFIKNDDYMLYCSNFVNGKFAVPAKGNVLPVRSPHNYREIGEIRVSTKEDVDQAVLIAKRAFTVFSSIDSVNRSKVLRNIAQLIRDHRDTIAKMESLDTGKTVTETTGEVMEAAECFDFYASCALTIRDTYTGVSDTQHVVSIREPLGVCCGIGVWNFPFQNMAWKVAPALCMGNSFIFKPSPLTPLSACFLAKLCHEAHLPNGVLNVVQGDGTTGEHLCAHPSVAKVSFTGSVETGKKVAAVCSTTLKRLTMEMGGKSPLLIFEDAVIADAVNGAIFANYTIQGQVCSNASRVYVQESIYDQFRSTVVAATKAIKVGDPFDASVHSGAIISKEHFNRVMGFIERAKAEGATVLCGGEQLHRDSTSLGGYYISPCILEGCTDDMEISTEEVFGPVMCLYPFKTEKEAVDRANDTSFGLAAGVYTQNLSRAHRIAKNFDAGTIYINTYNMYPIQMPFGGRKLSGQGRECGQAVLDHYSDLKSILVETGPTPVPFN